MTAPATHEWFKSSYSGGSGTECVEAAFVSSGVLLRDSKNVSGPRVAIPARAWNTFTSALRRGQLGG
jgi:hypothetical protein